MALNPTMKRVLSHLNVSHWLEMDFNEDVAAELCALGLVEARFDRAHFNQYRINDAGRALLA